jgi:hypothetical protein
MLLGDVSCEGVLMVIAPFSLLIVQRGSREFVRLTRRAKHWQNGIIETNLNWPARDAIRGGLFHVRLARPQSRKHGGFDTSGKTPA